METEVYVWRRGAAGEEGKEELIGTYHWKVGDGRLKDYAGVVCQGVLKSVDEEIKLIYRAPHARLVRSFSSLYLQATPEHLVEREILGHMKKLAEHIDKERAPEQTGNAPLQAQTLLQTVRKAKEMTRALQGEGMKDEEGLESVHAELSSAEARLEILIRRMTESE
ncbi:MULTISPECIES: hypothetical protein [Paenibacillus]|uniref:hypothetical protein n=1 Tax=Paenibacillus TaxID=44249 RepID=UPI0022B93C68|nr:hypothetical protein [Paenibacillus caseinilyticus]MCZ8521220.1 hypothetical protein [Paenibacillus caseinilyticus]